MNNQGSDTFTVYDFSQTSWQGKQAVVVLYKLKNESYFPGTQDEVPHIPLCYKKHIYMNNVAIAFNLFHWTTEPARGRGYIFKWPT